MSLSTHRDSDGSQDSLDLGPTGAVDAPGEDKVHVNGMVGLGCTLLFIVLFILAMFTGDGSSRSGRNSYAPSASDIGVFDTPADLKARWRPMSEHEKRQRAIQDMLNADSAQW